MSKLVPRHGRDHRVGGPDPIPGFGGLAFDTYPQDGGWFYVRTTDAGTRPPNGPEQEFVAEDSFYLRSMDGSGGVTSQLSLSNGQAVLACGTTQLTVGRSAYPGYATISGGTGIGGVFTFDGSPHEAGRSTFDLEGTNASISVVYQHDAITDAYDLVFFAPTIGIQCDNDVIFAIDPSGGSFTVSMGGYGAVLTINAGPPPSISILPGYSWVADL